jgi:hypothetical protein
VVTFLFTDVEGSTKLWENYPTGCGGRETPLETFLPEGIRKLIAEC